MTTNIIIADKKIDKATNLFNYLQSNNNFIKIIGLITNEKNLIKYLSIYKIDILIINFNIIENKKKLLNILNNINIDIIVLTNDMEKIDNSLKKICISKSNIDIKRKIDYELSYFNFNKASIGYTYIIEAIAICYNNMSLINNLEKELFPIIASTFNIINSKSIKWDIQKTIDSMIRFTDTKKILNIFPYTQRPTPNLFISVMSRIIISKYKNL